MTRTLADYPQVTPAEVRATFDYDPDFGCLLRIRKDGFKKLAGTQAKEKGEVRTFWKDVYWPVHLLVWIHQVGAWPSQMPVHRDKDRGNNTMTNLCTPRTLKAEKAQIAGMIEAQRVRLGDLTAPEEAVCKGVVAAPNALTSALSSVLEKAMSGRNANAPKETHN